MRACLIRGLTAAAAGILALLTAPQHAAASASGSGSGERAPLVVIGVAGLTWERVSAERTPTLWRLLEDGSAAGAATLVTIGRPQCPGDGWLSLSAGRAAAAPRDDENGCLPGPEIRPRGGGAAVSEWPAVLDAQSASDYAPAVGTLAEALDDLGACAIAVGPGAALALANGDGNVRRYRSGFVPGRPDCPVTVVDGGVITGDPRSATRADRFISTVVDGVGPRTTVLIQGITGSEESRRPELGVTMVTGTSMRLLTSRSTRWDGVVRLLDLPNTVLEAAAADALPPADFSGTPIIPDGRRPADPARAVRELSRTTEIDHMLRDWSGPFLWLLGGGQLILYGCALWLRSRLADAAGRDRWRRLFGVAAMAIALVPVSSYLVTLGYWWLTPAPGPALAAGIIGLAAAGAWLVSRLPTEPIWRTAGAISLLTAGVLTVDAIIGTPLHRGSLLGPSAIFGGRYYGFGNPTFSIFAVAALMLAGAVATELIERGRRRAAATAVLGIGGAATFIVVWPGLGANVGGGIALVPGVAVLVFKAAGIRLTALRLAAAGAAGFGLLAAVGVLDWLRPPPERAHAGRFVQSIIDGDAWETIARKAGFALGSLQGGPVAWITAVLLVVVLLALARPARFAPAYLTTAAERWPLLPRTLGAIMFTAIFGAFVNDYGIRIITFAFLILLPMVAAVSARSAAIPDPDRRTASHVR